MSHITVLTGYRRPEKPTLDAIAKILGTETNRLKVDRTKETVGYVTVIISNVDATTHIKLLALENVSEVR